MLAAAVSRQEQGFRFAEEEAPAQGRLNLGSSTLSLLRQALAIRVSALGESNQTYKAERYSRLNAVRERDELFAVFRYTF